MVESVTSKYVATREIHWGSLDCSGDPNTSPITDRYRILVTSYQILKYDIVSGRYFF